MSTGTLLASLQKKLATSQGIPAHTLQHKDVTASRIASIEALARKHMNKYWLLDAGWSFGWHNRLTHLGTCFYRTKEIKLSKKWTLAQLEQDAISGSTAGIDKITDTIKHEIAHALAPRGSKHGPAWVAMCLVTGANPSRVAQNLSVTREDVQAPLYVMRDTTRGNRIVKRYYRKPSQRVFDRIHTYRIPGREAETIGKIVLEKYIQEVVPVSESSDLLEL